MNFDKTIYKKDTKGKIRYLRVYTQNADLVQESGILDGTPVTHRSTCKGKNIGKVNETTPEQQAISEAESKVSTKMSTGYFETEAEAEEKGGAAVLLPMLAKDGKKIMDKIQYPCYAQPKLDGMRALSGKNRQMISRKGKAIETMGHIQDELNDDNNVYADVLDGELYAHGLNFQENMRLIKKYREGESENVKFHVYDIVLPDVPFRDRIQFLTEITSNLSTVKIVPTYVILNEAGLKRLHSEFLNQGYEGTIIRHTEDGYAVNKRANQLLKYKDFIDIAAEVVDVIPSDKNPEQGVVHCKIEAGTFGCGMKFSHKEREEILTNKSQYIGKMAEIRFFEYSEDGIPRFPVCYGFREDL